MSRDYRRMSAEQLEQLEIALLVKGNMNAVVEISDFKSVYNKKVEVIKGRKVPKGTTGTVFWVKRYDNSKFGDPWGIYSTTKVGFKDEEGNVHFTAIGNVRVVE